MKLNLYPGDSLPFKYNNVRNHVVGICATADALPRLDLKVTRAAPSVSLYSIPAGVLLTQMLEVVNLLSIPSEETLVLAQPKEEISIAKSNNTVDRKMGDMMKAFEAWARRLSTANDCGYGGYQTVRS